MAETALAAANSGSAGAGSQAFKVVWQQFLKDSDKLPGWVPLFVLTLATVEWAAPPQVTVFGKTLLISAEFLAGALTLLLYTVGDAIDEAVFKEGPEGARKTREKYKKMYQPELDKASKALGIGTGLYSVALKLASAGEKQRAKLAIHGPNELAKCLRALILPCALVAVVLVVQGRLFFAGTSVAAAVAFRICYPRLKILHIRRLYVAADDLSQDKRHYHAENLGTIRLVFWDGNFVGSGPTGKPSSEEGPSR